MLFSFQVCTYSREWLLQSRNKQRLCHVRFRKLSQNGKTKTSHLSEIFSNSTKTTNVSATYLALSEAFTGICKVWLRFCWSFWIKSRGRGKARPKTYLLLFNCLQTWAVHLELTEVMSMSTTLNAISKFVNIRGMPMLNLSDNSRLLFLRTKT